MKHIVVLTGAGMSAESGLKTFRDSNGLWEGHDVMSVASPQGFASNPGLVLDFYNERRRQLKDVEPNSAHSDLANLENDFKVSIVTQNVDDLHERAGSTNVLHLHGELRKIRSTGNDSDIKDWTEDINLGDVCENGHQLRPHIVWFGEDVPLIEDAITICETADILMIIGTSMQVYPAAGLMNYVKLSTPIYFIDPNPAMESNRRLTVIAEPATVGIKTAIQIIKENVSE
ncbi:Sir2 family NAD-dependent protein deacetylase [Winogradskyella maritima]|uniref:NAD-dependent protein deacylase n=1 Tax=Winogradskyella maritima TaxID=1517766 RepID=A0ABV8AKB2_9FLAO|nr:Sir2 family NAD-dependent protein deacetylase [Winogradskyella maritima]